MIMSGPHRFHPRRGTRHLSYVGIAAVACTVVATCAVAALLDGAILSPPLAAAAFSRASGPLQEATPSPTAIPEAPSELPGLLAYTRRADADYVWEIYQSRADGTGDRPVTHHALSGKGADAPRWSPDGAWIAYSTTDKAGQVVTLWRMDHAGGTPVPLATVRSPQAGAVSVGPQSDRIVFVGVAVVGPSTTDLLVKTAGQDATTLVATSEREEDAPDWSSATGRVAFSGRELSGPATSRGWDLYVVEADGSDDHLVVGADGVSECSPRWSPDGRRLAYLAINGQTCFGAGTLRVRDLESGQDDAVVGGASIQAAWSPDGLWLLVYNTYNGGLYAPGQPTPAPQARQQLKGLYALRLVDQALFRLRGAAGGSEAKDGSYLWGQVADWSGGTHTPTPPVSPTTTPTETPEASATPTPSITPFASVTDLPSRTPPTATRPPSASPSVTPERSPTGDNRPRIFLPLLLKDWLLVAGSGKRR